MRVIARMTRTWTNLSQVTMSLEEPLVMMPLDPLQPRYSVGIGCMQIGRGFG